MHQPQVTALLNTAREKLVEALAISRQAPDDLGQIKKKRNRICSLSCIRCARRLYRRFFWKSREYLQAASQATLFADGAHWPI